MPSLVPALQIDGAIATLTLRRPHQANRLGPPDLEALHGHLAQVNDATQVRVLLLQAEGAHFCAGFQLDALDMVDAGALFARCADALAMVRPVSIALLQGGAYGGGADLALACDLRLGTPATRAFIPAARIGLHFYVGGLRRLSQRLGHNAARRLLLADDTLEADALLACGYLDALHPDAEALASAGRALAHRLADLAPLAVEGMKRHLNALESGVFDPTDAEADIAAARTSLDLREGLDALRQRRPPHFLRR